MIEIFTPRSYADLDEHKQIEVLGCSRLIPLSVVVVARGYAQHHNATISNIADTCVLYSHKCMGVNGKVFQLHVIYYNSRENPNQYYKARALRLNVQ